jgi:hypothetical protein
MHGIPEWPAGRSGIPSWVFLKHPLTRTSPRRGSRKGALDREGSAKFGISDTRVHRSYAA